MDEDQRRSQRVVTDLYGKFAEIDEDAVLRRGDISETGVMLEIDEDLGSPGTVHWLEVSASDRGSTLAVMARVIRTMQLDAVDAPTRRAVALEFLPESAAKKSAIEKLMRRVLALASQDKAHESADLEPMPAAVYDLAVHRMEVVTSWPVKPGDVVQVVFRAPDRSGRLPFEGRIEEVRQDEAGFVATVGLGSVGRAADGIEEISQSMDLLFDPDVVKEEPNPEAEDFAGQLSRIQLPSILSLFELEKSSGSLVLERNGTAVTVYFQLGQIVDAEGGADELPRAALSAVLTWTDGTFSFHAGEVDRDDQFGVATTHLMLDLFREHDEADK